MGVKSKTGRQKLLRRQRMKECVQLRIAGLTYAEIAERLGIGETTAYEAVKDALEWYAKDTEQEAKRLKEIQSARIERLILAVWPQAVKGHMAAVDRVVRLLDRQAKLHGLDAATRHDLKVDGEAIVFTVDASSGIGVRLGRSDAEDGED